MAFAQAEVDRAAGDFVAARQRIAEALESDPEGWNSRYGWPLIWLGMRVEAESGDPDGERVAALARLAETFPVPTGELAAYRALTAAEQARRDGTAAPWEAAVAAARAGNAPFLLAYALLRLAEALAGSGDRGAAASAVTEAIALADDVGAEPVAEQARALARRARLVEEPASEGENGFGLTGRELEGAAARRRRSLERPDRRDPVHQPQDSLGARLQHPRQARGYLTRRGGCLSPPAGPRLRI
jgi:hypothetical protein